MGASLNGVFVPIKSHLISDLRKLAQQWGERVGSARDYRRPKFHRGVTWRRKNRRCTHTRIGSKNRGSTAYEENKPRVPTYAPTPSSFRCNVSDYTVFCPCLDTPFASWSNRFHSFVSRRTLFMHRACFSFPSSFIRISILRIEIIVGEKVRLLIQLECFKSLLLI